MAKLKFTKVETKKLKKLAQTMPDRLDAVGRKAATQINAEIVVSFGSGPPGRTYQLYNPRRTHVASKADYPPNVDIGELRAAQNWKPFGRLQYMIYNSQIYGLYLEFGTPKMAARPFISPVLEKWHRRELAALMRKEGLFEV